MFANNCPFNIKGTEYNYEESRKGRFVSFLVPLDPDDTDCLFFGKKIRKFSSAQ